MEKRGLCVILSLVVVFLAGVCLSQQEGTAVKEEQPQQANIEKAVEKAIKRVDAQKLKQAEKITDELKAKLNTVCEEWLAAAVAAKNAQLDKLIDQHWELIVPNPISAAHQYYYLRNYGYTITERDVLKSESLTDPYKAYMKLNEILYVERPHLEKVTYPNEFLYTAARPVTVRMEYKDGNFVVIDAEYGEFSLRKGWN